MGDTLFLKRIQLKCFSNGKKKHSIDRIFFLCFLAQLAFPTSALATSSVDDLEEESVNEQPAESAAEEPGPDGSF